MSPVVRHMRARIFHRLGLPGSSTLPVALAAAVLAPGCEAPDAADSHGAQVALTDANANDPSAELLFDLTAPGTHQLSPSTTPAPAFQPYLEVGPAAVLHPLDLMIFDAPADARVRFDVEGPTRSWTLEAETDQNGEVVFTAATGPILVGGDQLLVRAEVQGTEPLYTNTATTELATPACTQDTIAQPGSAAFLTDMQTLRVCEPIPVGGVCENHVTFHNWRAHDLLVNSMNDIVGPEWDITAICTETSIVRDCCYVVQADDTTVGNGGGGGGFGGGGGWLGRPFSVDGSPVSAGTCARPDWTSDDRFGALASTLPRRVRRRLARLWQGDATSEHASVASFARLTLELMHLGAPAELVAEATRAQADEIRHAQQSFALASHFAGAPVGPGPLDITGAMAQSTELEHILLGAVLEGCINETICAAWAAEGARRAGTPELRDVLTGIADDETRHAELSWSLVAWILKAHPELASLVEEAVALHDVGPRPAADPDAAPLALGGQLSDRLKHDLAQQVLAEVIRPGIVGLCHGTALAA